MEIKVGTKIITEFSCFIVTGFVFNVEKPDHSKVLCEMYNNADELITTKASIFFSNLTDAHMKMMYRYY